MRMPILRIEPGQSIELALKYVHGKEKPSSKTGLLEYEYVTSRGQILYLPPLAKDAIDSLHLGSDEPFTLTKKTGAGKEILWEVERIQVPPQARSEAQNGNGAKEAVSPPRRPIQTATSSGIHEHIATDEPGLTTPESQRVYRQLVAAIDAAQAAEKHAASIGFPITFTTEDIRALAISAYISQSQRRVA